MSSSLKGVRKHAIKQINKEHFHQLKAKTIDYINEAIKRQCPDWDYTSLTFQKYLADNPSVMEYLLKVFDEPGSRLLFVAPCGSGKTYMTCVDLANKQEEAGKEGKAIILLTPNTIQSDQNGKYFHEDQQGNKIYTIPITANNKNDIKLEPGKVYSIVYDSAQSRFESISFDLLKKVILIVDEAHLFEEAADYRGPVLNQIKELSKAVCVSGGNVMYMTGTPNRILWYDFNHLLECFKVDENGNYVNSINVDKIDLIQNAGKNNIATVTVSEVLKMKDGKETPIARYNTKKGIRQTEESLGEFGLDVASLNADKKGRVAKEILDDNGVPQQYYEFSCEMYKYIIEKDALVKKDVYLTTSLMDAGTSIKGILNEDGTISQDEKLVPVFVCTRSTEFDLDNILQFFARPRYNLNRAVIIMHKQKDKNPGKRPDLESCVVAIAQDALDALEAEKEGGEKVLRMPSLKGRTVDDLLVTLPNGQRDINIPRIFSLAVVMYYQQIAAKPDMMAELIEEELGIPCENHYITEKIDLQLARPEAVDPQVRVLAEKAMTEDKDFIKNLVEDKFDTNIIQIRALDGGKKVLQNILSLHMSDQFDEKNLVTFAIDMVENRRPTAINKEGVIVNPKTEPVDSFIRSLASIPLGRGIESQFVEFVKTYEKTGEADGNIGMIRSMTDGDTRKKLAYNIQTRFGFCKLRWLAKIWDEGNGKVPWKTACEVVARTAENELYSIYRQIFVVGLNAFDFKKDSKLYTKNVQQYRLESGAEYHALREYKGGFRYVDEDYADETDMEIREKHTRDHFVGGIDGKIVSRYDCEQIAKQLREVMKKMGLKHGRGHEYTWKEVEKGIKSIFRTYAVKDSDGNVVEDKFRAKGLRMSVREAFGASPLIKDEVVANYESILTNEFLTCDEKMRALSHVQGELTELGMSKEDAAQIYDNLVSSIEMAEDCPFMDVKEQTKYFAGAFGIMVDAKKAVPEHEILTMEDVVKLVRAGITTNLDARADEIRALLMDMTSSFAKWQNTYVDFRLGLPGYVDRFDAKAFPVKAYELPEAEFDALKVVYEQAAANHKFYWDSEWYNSPVEVPTGDVDPRVSVLWRTDPDVYRGLILDRCGTYI